MSAPVSGDPRDRVYHLRARAARLRREAEELERLAVELSRELRRRRVERPPYGSGSRG